MKKFLTILVKSVIRHNIGYLAAVVSYFAFTSMIPVVLLLIYLASIILSGTEVEHFFDELLQSYVPAMPSGTTTVNTTIHHLSTLRPVIGIIGFVGLLWGSIGGLVSLQQTLDTICEVHRRRSFVKQYIIGFGMLGLLLALVVVSAAVTALSPAVVERLGQSPLTSWILITHAIARVLFAIIMFAVCYFAYRFLPSKVPSNFALVIGSAVATCCIYISRELFAVYTHHLGNYQLIYGALTYVMLLTFWIYIASIIFLFGMEVSLAIHATKQSGIRAQ
ncbi:YihY/virulence factor BrkB family protein [Alicyclobacillus dauci]|uniref:YihY/virulence factor BrkB family protein n=1 Tax=Alicyclobacillus dauci TaxID=1475485 RepID=A0ABY6Z2X3_9BACL|nr:YihY/virulence factor BrkB family protein [Alicyclobacillus dauci]WAH36551.1 YihY/virulence factor BrkB family protein [Alicyclobacillus dauci]